MSELGYEDKPGKVLRVALLGCGVVGSQVARLLAEQADDLAERTGARLELQPPAAPWRGGGGQRGGAGDRPPRDTG